MSLLDMQRQNYLVTIYIISEKAFVEKIKLKNSAKNAHKTRKRT